MVIQASGVQSNGQAVVGSIRNAAAATGTNFEYLLATAQVESGLNPKAAASGSSARGLFQFIDQTWLTTVKESGSGFGYERYADAITRLPSGRYQVADPAKRREVMALRNDPDANAAMAGAFTQKNAERLTARIGREPTDGELYMAHFLGAAGAGRLISSAAQSPNASAADAFPNAARANPSIFYDRQGNARSNSEVYGVLAGRYQTALNSPRLRPFIATTDVAATSSASRIVAAKTTVIDATQTATAVPAGGTAQTAPSPGFTSLFSDNRSQPVSPVIHDLWTTRPTVAAALTGGQIAVAPTSAAATPLDLFADGKTNGRRLFGVGS